MALVSKSIPNLINGVSQQPPAIRLTGQAEVQENGFSDVVAGLQKRAPTAYLNKLKKTDPAGSTYLTSTEINRSFFHTYKRSTDEQYTVIFDPVTTKMYVYDINGILRYESGVRSWDANGNNLGLNNDDSVLSAYFGNNTITSADITTTSVSDYTFFVNKKKTVAIDNASPDFVRPHEGLIYMKVMNYGKDYDWAVKRSDDPLTAGDDTWSGTSGAASTLDGGGGDANLEVVGLKTGQFFDITVDGNTVSTSTLANQTTVSSSQLSAQGLQTRRSSGDPFVVIETTQANGADFQITVSDDNGGNDLFGFKDTAQDFTALPKSCAENFTIQVQGDNQKKEDDFYVKYVGNGSIGSWTECAQPSRPNEPVYHNLDQTTMPHTLKQLANGAFSFTVGTWDERKCGDDNTNPFPSFVGQTINDVFFHRNRLGFLSDENVIFSEASNYFNFFRVTVRSLLDSAPIDVAVSQNEVSILKHAIPYQEQLLMFSDLNQFSLSSDSLLTPSEVAIDTSTKFECDLTSKPASAGKTVFFATSDVNSAGVREYVTDANLEINDAPLITAHIPSYIEGNIREMIASTNLDMLVCLTTANKKEAYIYKWYEPANERLQSSWSKFIFDTDVAHIHFNNSILYVVYSDGRFEKMDLSPVTDNTTVSYFVKSNTPTASLTTIGSFTAPLFIGSSTYWTYTGYSASGAVPSTSTHGAQSNLKFKQIQKIKAMNRSSNPYSFEKAWIQIEVENSALSSNAGTVSISDLPATITVGGVNVEVKDSTTVGNNYTGSAETFFRAARGTSTVIFQQYITETAHDSLWSTVPQEIKLNVSDTVIPQTKVLVDHLQTITTANNLAAIQSQYTPTANTQYIDHKGGLIATGSPADGSEIYTYLAGTHTLADGTSQSNFVSVGEPYNFKYQLSEQVFRPSENDPSQIARFQLKNINFHYSNTGAFDVTVAATGRDPRVTSFTGRILGDEDNVLGFTSNVDKGSFKVGVQSQAKEVAITINNNSHKPCVFQSAEWEGEIQFRGKRI